MNIQDFWCFNKHSYNNEETVGNIEVKLIIKSNYIHQTSKVPKEGTKHKNQDILS
jgi:hypothetical protein